MKNFFKTQKLYIIGFVLGAIVGYFYWKLVGCNTGTCMITSSPIRSTLYFGVMGTLFLGIFKKEQHVEQP